MGHQLAPLETMVPGWSSTDPSTGSGLLQADVESLSDVARELRRHLVDALNATERPAILHPQAAFDVLRKGHIRPIRDRWNAYQLDRDRRTVRVPHESGGTRNVLSVSRKAPEPDQLPALPGGGAWLLIWHGSVDVLSIPGVSQRLAHLRARTSVADVLFYQDDGTTPELFSLMAKKGSRGGKAVDFPDPDALRDADPTTSR